MFLRLVVLCTAVLGATLAGAQPSSSPKAVFNQIDSIVAELSEMTGWKPMHRVQYDVMNRTQLRQYLDEKIRTENKPEEIRAQELTLKKFGFVPANFDLAASTVTLMTEQAAAFYDEKRKKLFLLEGAEGSMEEVALVHELAHALADQHFALGKFMKQKGKSDDSELARLAVVEGQATWLMSEHLARRMHQSLRSNPLLIRLLNISSDAAAEQYPAFRDSPLYLRQLLLFPYSQGLQFQQAVLNKDGNAAFSEVFRRPPLTTQQLFHPDKYFARVEPTQPALPMLATPPDYKVLSEGSVGEFDHTVLLQQYVKREGAKDLAAHWRGGQYRLYENRKDTRLLLAYASEWDSAESARQFFLDYQDVLKGKWKTMKVDTQEASRLTGTGDDGLFTLELQGNVVRSREGLAALQ